MKDNANTDILNLSIKLVDEMVIIVYTKDEINNISELKQQLSKTNELCNEQLKNDACITNSKETVFIPEVIEKNEEIVSNNTLENKININKSSLDELKQLPKIGDTKAKAIIAYREEFGDFKTIDEIKNVKGIGDTLFESIKEYITI